MLRVHVAGWVKLTDASVPFSEAEVDQIHRRGMRGEKIFNDTDEKGDFSIGKGGKRRQHRGEWAKPYETHAASILRRCALLQSASGDEPKRVADAHSLTCLQNCRQQPTHCDAYEFAALRHLCVGSVPLSFVHGIMAGSSLLVYEAGCNGRSRRVEYAATEMVAFRGDFPHAGSPSEKANSRLHGYVDSKVAPREPNATVPCSGHDTAEGEDDLDDDDDDDDDVSYVDDESDEYDEDDE